MHRSRTPHTVPIRRGPATPRRTPAVLVLLFLAAIALVVLGLAAATGSGPSDRLPGASPTAPGVSSVEPVDGAPAAIPDVGLPRRVEVPDLGVDAPLHAIGLLPDGAMEMPAYGDVGWYDRGPRPGESGGAVVVAHVTGPAGADVFHRLATLRPGAEIVIHHGGGSLRFVVDAVQDVLKEELPYDRIWPATDRPLLRLVTCAGARTSAGYPENTVVYAHLA